VNDSQIKSNQIYFSVAGKLTHNIKVYIKSMTVRYWRNAWSDRL